MAPFPTDGVPELAVVRTPHIGGRLEFYRWTDGGLSIAATLDGYASHSIGSRNLDTAVAGDLDGDGLPEIVLPRNDMATLAGVRRTGDGAAEAWTLSVDAPVATNLAAVGRGDGSVVLGVGRSDGTVRFWR